MKISPTLTEVKEIAKIGKYDILPVSCEILSDFITPIEAMRILQNVSTHCYLLESAQANEAWGRYTFLGYDPKLEINCIDGHMKLGKLSVETEILQSTSDRFFQSTRVRNLIICLRLQVAL